MNAWLKLTWYDHSLTWDPNEYDGVADLRFKSVWCSLFPFFTQFDSVYWRIVIACRTQNVWICFDFPKICEPFRKNQLWTPDVLLYNSADPQFDSSFQSNLLVYPDGLVNWIPPGDLLILSSFEKLRSWHTVRECFVEYKRIGELLRYLPNILSDSCGMVSFRFAGMFHEGTVPSWFFFV